MSYISAPKYSSQFIRRSFIFSKTIVRWCQIISYHLREFLSILSRYAVLCSYIEIVNCNTFSQDIHFIRHISPY